MTAEIEEWKWDKWQKAAIEYEGSITLRCSRQSGKSTTTSKRAAKLMLKYKKSISLIIAPAQRQSSELFKKLMGWLQVKNNEMLEKAGGFKSNPKFTAKRNMELKRQFEYDYGIYNELPTKTTVILKDDFTKPQGKDNQGSICYALPAGKTGVYLRSFTLDFLYIDEAAYCPETVYIALKPMLAISEKKRGLGWETFLSTPFGKGGFFFDSHHSKEFKKFHVKCTDCDRISKSFLRKQKKRLSRRDWRQEYLAEFTEDMSQFFPTALIKKCANILEWDIKEKQSNARYYLGVDFAGHGGDENAFIICEMVQKKMRIVKCWATDRVSCTDTIGRIVKANNQYNFSKIFVDDGGLGSPITDMLQDRLGRKVVGLNNARKRLEVQGEEKKTGIFKEDLYTNALMLMEQGKVDMINDIDLQRSLKSITFKYGEHETSKNKISIFGKYTHLTEAMVRALWCYKEKGLRLFCY